MHCPVAHYFVQLRMRMLRSPSDNTVDYTPVKTLGHALLTALCIRECKVSNLWSCTNELDETIRSDPIRHHVQ